MPVRIPRPVRLLETPGEPVGTVSVDGVEHVVERVSDPERIDEISAAVASNPALIADGHHRYAVARQYRDERRAEGRRRRCRAHSGVRRRARRGPASVEAIHRLYTGITADELATQPSAAFEVEPADGELAAEVLVAMQADGCLALVRPDGWEWLVPGSALRRPPRSRRALAGGDAGPTAAEVTYQHGLDEIVAAVPTATRPRPS